MNEKLINDFEKAVQSETTGEFLNKTGIGDKTLLINYLIAVSKNVDYVETILSSINRDIMTSFDMYDCIENNNDLIKEPAYKINIKRGIVLHSDGLKDIPVASITITKDKKTIIDEPIFPIWVDFTSYIYADVAVYASFKKTIRKLAKEKLEPEERTKINKLNKN